MKNLSSYTVIGLILLSSLPAFSADGDASSGQKDTQVVMPPGIAPPVIDKSQEEGKTPEGVGGVANDPKKIVEPIKTWRSALSTCPAAQKSAESILADIDRNAKKYQESQDACKTREDKANTFCMESRNPDIKNFISIAQVLTAGLSGMMDACSKFGKVMDVGNKALTAYQALCSSWRGYCNAACGDAVNGVKAIQAKKKDLVDTVVKVATAEGQKGATSTDAIPCMALAKSYPETVQNNDEAINAELKVSGDYKAVAQKFETCKSYGKELATAALGGLSMLKSLATANKCEDDTKSTTAAATPTPVDCTIAANKQNNMTCICQDAPRTPGCNNGLDSATVAKNGDALRAASSGSYTPGTTGSNTGIDGSTGDGTDLSSKSPDGGGGSSLPGAPSGGGGGLGGGSGGFGGGAGGAEAKKANGLNTNILGGEGGGGGGGSWGGYGYDKDPALRQYLPGGAKDPAAMAGAAVSKQVTSQGGKSNWEKVKERYRDNKPSLLGY
ncbi:MAG: hypothetical protein JSU04_01460 [Bdellovibrionales bacterium]|nr:hypothetical protein [Bdellovibrionales bacterium]